MKKELQSEYSNFNKKQTLPLCMLSNVCFSIVLEGQLDL